MARTSYIQWNDDDVQLCSRPTPLIGSL